MADITERRKHIRFAVIEGIAEPVEVHFPPPFYQDPIVGKIINISAGGLGLAVSEPLPKFFTFSLFIRLRGIEPFEVKGKVIRLENDSGQYIAGISFTQVDEQTAEMLKLISEDFEKCRKKRAEGVKDFCFEECMFGTLCDKTGKSAQVHESRETSSGIVVTGVKEDKKEEDSQPEHDPEMPQFIAEKEDAPSEPSPVPPSVMPPVPASISEIPVPVAEPPSTVTETTPTVPEAPLTVPVPPAPVDEIPAELTVINKIEDVTEFETPPAEVARQVEEKIITKEPACVCPPAAPAVSLPAKKSAASPRRKNVLSVGILIVLTALGIYILKDKITQSILMNAEKKLLIPEYASAVKNYNIVLKYEPKNTGVRFKLASAYARMRMYANAEREYREVLNIQADNLQALFELGKINLKLNRIKQAESYLKKAKYLSKNDALPGIYLGICYEKEKDYESALKEFSGISADAKLPEEAYLPIGKVFGLNGNLKTAVLFLSRTNLPKSAVEYFETGIVKNEAAPDEAVINFLKAIAKKSDFTEAYEWLGFLYRKKALYDSSLDAYRDALNINPHSARVIFNIAQIHALKDDVSSALSALDQAVSLDRTYIELAKNSYEFNEIKNTSEFKKVLRKK